MANASVTTLPYSTPDGGYADAPLASVVLLICLVWSLLGFVALALHVGTHASVERNEIMVSDAQRGRAIETMQSAYESVRDRLFGPPPLLPEPEYADDLADPVEWPGTQYVIEDAAVIVHPLLLIVAARSLSRRRWVAVIGRLALSLAAVVGAWFAIESWLYATEIWSSGADSFSDPPDAGRRWLIAASTLGVDLPLTLPLLIAAIWLRRRRVIRSAISFVLLLCAVAALADPGDAAFRFTSRAEMWAHADMPALLHPIFRWLAASDHSGSVFSIGTPHISQIAGVCAAIAGLCLACRHVTFRSAGITALVPLASIVVLMSLGSVLYVRSSSRGPQNAKPSTRLLKLAQAVDEVADWTPAFGFVLLAGIATLRPVRFARQTDAHEPSAAALTPASAPHLRAGEGS